MDPSLKAKKFGVFLLDGKIWQWYRKDGLLNSLKFLNIRKNLHLRPLEG